MKKILIVFFLFSTIAHAEIKTNANGKTLNQFFAMASDILQKPIIVDSQVKQNIIIYGDANVSDFKSFFYSVLNAYNLSAFDDGTLIKISVGGNSNKTNIESIESFVSKVTQDVYIDGSLGQTIGEFTKYYYSFSYSSGDVFDPLSVGMEVVSVSNCMAYLSFNDYKTLVTCNPRSNNTGEPLPIIENTPDTNSNESNIVTEVANVIGG